MASGDAGVILEELRKVQMELREVKKIAKDLQRDIRYLRAAS